MDRTKRIVAHFESGVPDNGTINLSWDDCGEFGASTKSFTCDTNTGPPFMLVGSFVPPTGIDQFIGIEAEIRIQSTTPSLPDWWKFGTGQCRGVGIMSVSFDFTSGPSNCVDVYQFMAAGGFAYDVEFMSPDRARFRAQCAIPMDQAVALDPTREYYAFKLFVTRLKTIGTGSCNGCTVPMNFWLEEIGLYEAPNVEITATLTQARHSTFVSWQGPSTGVVPALDRALAITGAQWDRDGRGGRVTFTLPRAGRATLEAFDLGGRRLHRQELAGFAAGAHEVQLNTDRAWTPGVYYLRLTQDLGVARRTAVLAR
jgi:hypothetical protein